MIKYYLHAGSENHGCEAIVRSTTKLLNQDCILYSLNPNSDIKYGINQICNLKEDSIVAYRKYSWKWFLASLQTKFTGKIDFAVKFQRSTLLKNIAKKDICLSIGGDNYCYAGTDIIAALDKNIKKKGAKTVLWGCSVEPKILEDNKIVEDIKSFDLITARETITYEALSKINKNTVLVSDPAFTLESCELPLPEKWIEGNMVGINASPLILNRETSKGIVYESYKNLIQTILDETDMGVVLIPHVVCSENNDLEILTQLYNEFEDSSKIVLLGDYNCSELKGYIARCRFFIGARTHATIAAYSSGVPTLVVGYSVKARGIAKDLFGTEEKYVLPVQSIEKVDNLTKNFMWIKEHEKEIKEHLNHILPTYISKAYEGKKALELL